MKLVTYKAEGKLRGGILVNDHVYDLQACANTLGKTLPYTIREVLGVKDWQKATKAVEHAILSGKITSHAGTVELAAPLPNPPSCRDAYAFRQHVETARRNRGVPMIPEFDQYPVFYFTNHNAIFGGGEIILEEDHLQKLDFELEVAMVIGKKGRNIPASHADEYIAGITIMNDLSARTLQMEEMKLNLGPAKGKDFATAIGPWLVTPDELSDRRISTSSGATYDLEMKAFHNGELISVGNMKDMTWTFAEIIERASYGVDLYPGDVIGSGTVGTGCYLELNGTRALQAKEKRQDYEPVWLRVGDTISLTIDGLGTLTNTFTLSGTGGSLLLKKKLTEEMTA